MKFITRTVWILSLVSLFTDAASEMLYPVMPVYLKEIGFSVLLIGILEGFAEAVAGLSKGYFGNLSDHYGTRVPFVRLGYIMSALSKPLMAVVTIPIWVFFTRSIDRLGKGLRTAPRDALLVNESTPQTRGRIFGFHRSMDTLGAAIGPFIALVFLYVYPGQYKWLFFFAGIPGLIAICCTFFLKESGVKQPRKTSPVPGLLRFISFIKTSSVQYRKLFSGLLIFTVLNSSDLFILLRAKECGLSDTLTIGSYILYNLVYALTSAPIGALADKMGLKKTFISGLLIFSFVYFGLGLVQETYSFFMLFALYGIYAAATEGISKAWISLVSKPAEIATAIGTLTAFQSICTLLSGIFAGWFWFKFGSSWMFMTTGILTFFVVVYFMLFVPSFKHERST